MAGSANGKWQQELQEAFLDAYRKEPPLARMLTFELNVNLNDVTGPGSLEDRVFELINHFDSLSKMPQLVAAALRDRPDNQKLQEFCRKHPDLCAVSVPAVPPSPRGPETGPSGTRAVASSNAGGEGGRRKMSCSIVVTLCTLLVVGGMVLLPDVEKSREAAARRITENNYKEIGLASFNYTDAHGTRLPGPFVDRGAGGGLVAYPAAEDKRLSWRVALLPYMEQEPLYQKFDLGQPWDGPTNRPRADDRVRPFVDPNDVGSDTRVRVFYDGGAVFASDPGRRIAPGDVAGGTSNTILLVEARDAVTWTQFNDFKFDPSQPLPPLGHPSRASKGFYAAMADGSVRFISPTVQPEVIKAAISRSSTDKAKLGSE